MFKSRAANQNIDFTKLGTSMNMPISHELTNGDSIKLKYEEYEIEVVSIESVNETNITGVVDSISNINSDDIFEIDGNINIKVGDKIEFKESNVFHCTRLS